MLQTAFVYPAINRPNNSKYIQAQTLVFNHHPLAHPASEAVPNILPIASCYSSLESQEPRQSGLG